MPDRTQRLRVSRDALYRDLRGEAVLLHVGTGRYFGLDEVGNRMWQLIQELGDLRAVEEKLLAEFDVEPAKLSADLDRFVEQLAERKLVETV